MQMAPQHRVYAGFFIFAVGLGGLLSRLADLQLQFEIEEGVLGLTIIGMSMGALVSLTLSGPLIARLGQKLAFYITLIGFTTALALVPLMPHIAFVFVCLFVAGLNIGALEIALNTEADRIEAMIDRRIMNRAHGFWSIGFFVAALASTPIREALVSPAVHMGLTAVLVAVMTHLSFSTFLAAPARGKGTLEKPAAIARPTRAILVLCAVGMTPMLMEGAGLEWSVIFMRDTFDASPSISSLGLVVFAFFMAAGRIFGDRIVERFGPRDVVLGLLVLCLLGLLGVGFAPNPAVALLGFGLMGVGASAIYPVLISEAARRTDRPAETNVAAFAQIVFSVFLLGPPLLGFVAQYFGIRMTYLVCVPLVLFSVYFAFRVSRFGNATIRPAAT